jgi:hypothetical protein
MPPSGRAARPFAAVRARGKMSQSFGRAARPFAAVVARGEMCRRRGRAGRLLGQCARGRCVACFRVLRLHAFLVQAVPESSKVTKNVACALAAHLWPDRALY